MNAQEFKAIREQAATLLESLLMTQPRQKQWREIELLRHMKAKAEAAMPATPAMKGALNMLLTFMRRTPDLATPTIRSFIAYLHQKES